jgi:hypothetical protein
VTEAHALYYPESDWQGRRPSQPWTVWRKWQGKVVEIKWLDPTIHEGRYYRVIEADPEFVMLAAVGEDLELMVRLADIDHGWRRV